LGEEHDAYVGLLDNLMPSPLGDLSNEKTPAWVLSLDQRWQPCIVQHVGGRLWVTDTAIDAGMSGSPILLDGSAVGLISVNHGPQPRLMHDLPAWCLKLLGMG
jgi:hypothetical protein